MVIWDPFVALPHIWNCSLISPYLGGHYMLSSSERYMFYYDTNYVIMDDKVQM